MLAAGCHGAQIRAQQKSIESLQKQVQDQATQAKTTAGKVTALENEKGELEGQVAAAQGQVAAAQQRIQSLEKSNGDLSSSLESRRGQLMKKVGELIAEKDEISRKLTDALKEKIGLKSTFRSRLASANQANAALTAERDALKAEKEQARLQAASKIEKAKADGAGVAEALRSEGIAEQVILVRSGEALKLTLPEGLLFKPNEAKLTPEGALVLEKVGKALQAALAGRGLRVEGHHDNAPVKALFGVKSTPWDISSARAVAVARALVEKSGLEAQRVYAAGYGEFRPVVPNETPEGRAANRRVVLVLEPQPENSASEPVPSGNAAPADAGQKPEPNLP